MKYIQILTTTCATDVSSCCSDYGIATFLYVMRQALKLIQIGVPILLIVMGAIQLGKMMLSPDDKKATKSLINKFIAAIFVFFTPYIINLVLSILPDNFQISACWASAEGIAKTLQSTEKYELLSQEVNEERQKKLNNAKKYQVITEKDVKEKKAKKKDTSTTAGEKITNYALQFVGYPYVYGGASLTHGCDCSHFVYLVLKDVGAYHGKYVTSSNWASLGKAVKGGLKNAQAGDVIVYDGHVGIYDGKKYLIEAKGSKYGITHDRRPQDSSKKLLGVRRFV